MKLLLALSVFTLSLSLFASKLSRRIDEVEKRLETYNFEGNRINTYEFTKALEYLHVAKQEQKRNGKRRVIKEVLDRVDAQLDLLATKGDKSLKGEFSSTLPLNKMKDKKRGDLWKKAEDLKKYAGIKCAAHKIAQAEVLLVWGGFHQERLGRNYADQIYKMAHDRLIQGERLARFCHLSACPWNEAKQKIANNCFQDEGCKYDCEKQKNPWYKMKLEASALFNFDRYQASEMKLEGKRKLDKFSEWVKDKDDTYQIILMGHTDPIGSAKYNEALSKKRNITVKRYLAAKGLDAAVIKEVHRGESKQIYFCKGKRGQALKDCLLPNRRVEVYIKFSGK